MALNVNSAFTEFCNNSVNLQKEQLSLARNSRDWLLKNINMLSSKGLIPSVYEEMNVKYGSFARSTKIQPLDDIDLMLCYCADGGEYYEEGESQKYTISYESPNDILSTLCENNILNSRKVVENLKLQLAQLPGYSKADIHRNQEAVTLKLSSYSWNFDIVPCFITTSGFYLIPDGGGNWKKTDPRIDNKRTSLANSQHGGKLLQWIRIMKYWKALDTNPWKCLSSYAFEQMLLDISEQIDFNRSTSLLIEATFNALSSAIIKPIWDPKKIQGDLNNILLFDRLNLKTYAETQKSFASNATYFEIYRNSDKDAIECWKQVFGSSFPSFG